MSASSTPTLDRRTVLLCIALAAVAALLAGVIAVRVLGGDDATAAGGDNGAGSADRSAKSVDGGALLAVPLRTREGDATTLGEFRQHPDRPLVVNLWAQSCAPCVHEMPLLERASRRHADTEVIGVNELDRTDRAERTARQRGITYLWALDTDGSFGLAAGTSAIPDTLLIDTDGNVLATKVGAFSSDAQFDRWLARGLAAS